MESPHDRPIELTARLADAAAPAGSRLFAGAGEMRRRCRNLDWSSTALGPVDGWPSSLRTTVAIVLASGFPTVLVWGEALVQIYNDAYIELIGRKHPDALGAPTHETWPEIRTIQEPIFARVFAGETVRVTDARYPLDRNGVVEDAFFTATFVPVRDERGVVAGSLSTLFETTEQVAGRRVNQELSDLLEDHAAALHAERGMVRTVMEQLPVGVAIAEARSGRLLVLNDAITRIWRARRPKTKSVAEYSHEWVGYTLDGRRIASDEWPIARAALHGETVTGWRCRIVREDGEPGLIEISAAPTRDENGEITMAVAVVTDVTERVQAEEERERLLAAAESARSEAERSEEAADEANRAKSEFLAVMSHELRTPLNAIAGYAELIDLGIHGPVTADQHADLARIKMSQRHLLGLINDVLNYAKLESGSVHYELADVSLAEALASAADLVAPQARARGLELVVRDFEAQLVVRADPDKLRQILANLLSNAVKFTPPGGRIELAARHADGVARVTVHDSGIGIPRDRLADIFEPFVQVRADLTRTAEGTGLGLAISRDLARGMGGELTAESRLGAGSTFTLELPLA